MKRLCCLLLVALATPAIIIIGIFTELWCAAYRIGTDITVRLFDQ